MTAERRTVHLHLVSDSTGETVLNVAHACMVQFDGIQAVEHLWNMVRSKRQLDPVVKAIDEHRGLVMFTLVDSGVRASLEEACRRLQVPCIAVLDPVIGALAGSLGVESKGRPGIQHALDAEYFSRIDAMHFVLGHDDGQALGNLENADVVLVGVSRTSKTPTCIYLANRGVKAANVPIVPGLALAPELVNAKRPMIVGLTFDPVRLVQIRRNRLRQLHEDQATDYTDPEKVREEVAWGRRIFAENDWPVIDVTRRSIEETAAAVMQLVTHRGE